MAGAQDWVQQCYVCDLVLVHNKIGKGERNEKKLKKIVVKYSEMRPSVHLNCKLIYRALRIGLLRWWENKVSTTFPACRELISFSHLTGVRLGWR